MSDSKNNLLDTVLLTTLGALLTSSFVGYFVLAISYPAAYIAIMNAFAPAVLLGVYIASAIIFTAAVFHEYLERTEKRTTQDAIAKLSGLKRLLGTISSALPRFFVFLAFMLLYINAVSTVFNAIHGATQSDQSDGVSSFRPGLDQP